MSKGRGERGSRVEGRVRDGRERDRGGIERRVELLFI